MRSIVWMASSKLSALCERFATEPLVASSAQEFVEAPRDAKTISFLDDTTIAVIDDLAMRFGDEDVPSPEWRKMFAAVSLGPVILISSEPAPVAMAGLHPRRYLSHVISASMLEHPSAEVHLARVSQAATAARAPKLMDWLGPEVSGRRARLAVASRRGDRLNRMSEYVAAEGANPRTVQQLRDAADELITNAFYDAPVAAGAVDKPIPRTQDVSLPEESACDLAYGCHGDLAFVRVQDPFGALSRARLVEALARSATGPAVDDAMGGAGRGLSRIFSAASLVAISVVNNHHTEVLVGFLGDATAAPRPFAFHLFIKDSARRRLWKSADQDTAVSDPSFNNTFVSIVLAGDPD